MRIHGFGMRGVVGVSAAAVSLCAPAWSASGDVVWEQQIAAGHSVLAPQLAALDSWVFAHSTEHSTDPPVEVLSAYRADSGQLAWETRGRSGWDQVALGQSVAAARDRVFTATQLRPEGRANPRVAEIAAREAASGALLWTRELDDENDHLILQIAASRDALVVVGARSRDRQSRAMVLALDVVTGETLWSDFFPISTSAGPSAFAGRVELAKGRVIVSASSLGGSAPGRAQTSVLKAYDARTGRLLWQTPRADRQLVSVTTYRSGVYAVGIKRGSAIVSAYEIGSGERLWKRRVARASSDSITAANKVVAVYGRNLRRDSVLQVLDRQSGKPLWTVKHEDTWGSQVLGYRDRLFVIGALIGARDIRAGLYFAAFKSKTGRRLWSYPDRHPDRVGEATAGWQMLVHRDTLLAALTDEAVVSAIEP